MVTRLARSTRTIFEDAAQEARNLGSRTIEAEHLLLAISAVPDTEAYDVLASAGLGRESILAALKQEVRHSLAAAGIANPVVEWPTPSKKSPRNMRMGASARTTVERAYLATAGARLIKPGHLLLGILGAQGGTVPRALRFAGVSQLDLVQQAEIALGA
jgi:ATP-dependent Clp protease ATP-binding subunit ClpA